jgi:hypothetical protein
MVQRQTANYRRFRGAHLDFATRLWGLAKQRGRPRLPLSNVPACRFQTSPPAAFKRPRLPLSNVPADFTSVERWLCSRPDGLSLHIAPADFRSVERWFPFACEPRQRPCETGRAWVRGNSRQEATGFNHRSTDLKSAGAWMNSMPGSGAESLLHRREVGGGSLVAESRCAPASAETELPLDFPETHPYHDVPL